MYRLLQFICYDNNEDICTKHKVKDLPLWQEVNQSRKIIICTAYLRFTIRFMTIGNALWLSLNTWTYNFIGSHTHACFSEDGSSETHLRVKNILKNIYHV